MDFTYAQFTPDTFHDDLVLHAKATAYAREHGCSYLEAALAVDRQAKEQASLDPGEYVTLRFDAEVLPTVRGFSGCAYNGGPIDRSDGTLIIDLDTITLPAGGNTPILLNHDDNQRAGSALAEVLHGPPLTKLYLREGRFLQSTKAGRQGLEMWKNAHPLNLSVGVTGQRMTYPKGPNISVNGVHQRADYIMRNVRLHEVSIVTSGADPEARIDDRG